MNIPYKKLDWFPTSVTPIGPDDRVQAQTRVEGPTELEYLYPGDIFYDTKTGDTHVLSDAGRGAAQNSVTIRTKESAGGTKQRDLAPPEVTQFVANTTCIHRCLAYVRPFLSDQHSSLQETVLHLVFAELSPVGDSVGTEQYCFWWRESRPDAFYITPPMSEDHTNRFVTSDDITGLVDVIRSQSLTGVEGELFARVTNSPKLSAHLDAFTEAVTTRAQYRLNISIGEHNQPPGQADAQPHRISERIDRPTENHVEYTHEENTVDIRAGDRLYVPATIFDTVSLPFSRPATQPNTNDGEGKPSQNDSSTPNYSELLTGAGPIVELTVFDPTIDVVNHLPVYDFKAGEEHPLKPQDIHSLIAQATSQGAVQLQCLTRQADVFPLGEDKGSYTIHVYRVVPWGDVHPVTERINYLLAFDRHDITQVLLERPFMLQTVGADSLTPLVQILTDTDDSVQQDVIQTWKQTHDRLADLCTRAAKQAVKMDQLRPASPDCVITSPEEETQDPTIRITADATHPPTDSEMDQ